MKRSSAIDYLKFFFSIIIILYHYGIYIFGGYIVVEAFFMITGFLMMTSLRKVSAEGEIPADSTARFLLHKYSAIFLPLLFSALNGFLIYEKLIYQSPVEESLRRMPLMLFEVFPLQVAGYDGMWTTGISWYLSAMLLAIAILYPLARKAPERFAYTVCPILSLLLYGFLCMHRHHLDLNSDWILGLFNTGLLRAIAGISAGCLLYALVSRAKAKISIGMRIVYTVAELAGFWYLLKTIVDFENARTNFDFVLAAILFGILYVALSQKTLFSLFTNFKWTKILSTWSTYIFMNHYAWNLYFKNIHPDKTVEEAFPWYVLCVVTSSVVAWGLTTLVRLAIKRIKTHQAKNAPLPA